ncbi:MAG: hypothetical protein ACP5GG_02135, partial [Conexivisphaera sp.]
MEASPRQVSAGLSGSLFANGLLSRAFSYMLQVSLPLIVVYYSMLAPQLVGLSMLALWTSGGVAAILVAYTKSRRLLTASLVAMPVASLLGAPGGIFLPISFTLLYFLVSVVSSYLMPLSFVAGRARGTASYTAGISAGLLLGVLFQLAAASSPRYYLYVPISFTLSLAIALLFPRGLALGERRNARDTLAGILGPLMKEELHEMLSINVLSSAIWPLMTIYAEVFAIKVIGLSAPLAIVGVLLAAVTSMLSRVLLSFIGLERRPTLYFSIAAVSLGVITLSISSGVAQYYVATALIGLGHGLQMPLIYAATFESSQGRE